MQRLPALLLLTSVLPLLAQDAPKTFAVSEFTFTRPEAWTWVKLPVNPMRKAQLAIPAKDGGDPAEAVFFHFGTGNAGGLEANVSRWFRQFQGTQEEIKGRQETIEVGGHRVTYVGAEGTYLSGMPGGPQTPKPGFALRGAIIEAPQGAVFVKLTGPKAVVEGGDADFRKMVEGALKK
jgi:hypothetical protein